MPCTEDDSVSCRDCGYAFHGDDVEKTGERQPCPNCGSLKRAFHEKLEDKVVVKAVVGGEHEAHMSQESWTILGLILVFAIPPISYAIFTMLTIGFWYRLLIWLGIIVIPFSIAYKYRIIWYKIIMLLRFLADKTYGKHNI